MKSKNRKKLIYYLLCIFLVPLGLYFTITSNFFLTKVIVPYVGHLMKADFTVKHVKYDPYTSYLEIYDATVGDKGNSFISAKSASCYIDIFSLFKNRLKLSDLCIDEIDLNFIKDRRGKWSLPWLNTDSAVTANDDALTDDDTDTSGVILDFSNVNVSNMALKFKNNLSEMPFCVELKNLKLKTDHFKNGVLSLIKYNGNVQVVLDETVGVNKGNINGELSVNLDFHYIPSHVNLSALISDLYGNIGDTRIIDRKVSFKTDIRRQNNGTHCYDINFLNIRDSVDTCLESYLDMDGTLNFIPFKLLLNIYTGPICSPMLQIVNNLLGDYKVGNAKLFYFGNFVLSPDNIISQGKLLFSDINFAVGNYRLTNGVPLELFLDHNLNLDFNKKTITLKNLNTALSIKNKSIPSSNLNTPLTFNYKKERLLPSEAAPIFSIKSKDLDLKLLNIFMNKNVHFFTGKLNSDLALSINPQNNDITLKGNTDIENISFEINNYKPVDLDKEQALNFNIKNDINFNIKKWNKFKINALKFTSKQPKYDVGSTFILKEPFSFEIKQKRIIPDSDIKVGLGVKVFHLTDIVEYIPKSFPLKLNDGYLRYKYLLNIPETLDSLSVNGRAELLYSNFSFYGRPVNNLSISNNIDAVLYDINTLKVKDSVTEVYVNGVMGLLAKTTGKIAINEKKDSNLTMSIEHINKYFFDLFSNNISKNIGKLQAEGKILFDYTELNNTATVKGDFNLTETFLGSKMDTHKPSIITGGLKINLVETGKIFNVDMFNFSLKKEDMEIVNLDINGHFPIPLKKGISNLTVTSDCIALDEVVKICDILTEYNAKSKGKMNAVASKEYESMDFNGLNLKCNFILDNIFCGNLIKSVYHGKLDFKNNKISLRNEDFRINGTYIKFYGGIDTGSSDGYSYKLRTEFKNLDLNPIIKTFVSGEYKKTRGTVDKFSLSLQGKGFTKKNLKKNLVGVLSIMLNKLSLPYQIGEYKLLKIMLIPFEMLVKLREMLPGGLLVNNLKKGIESTKDIFANKNNINLAVGEIRLIAKNGKVNLNKIYFAGDKNDTVKYSNFSGTVDYDGKLEIKANSDINYIRLPISIYGYVEKPKINYGIFIPKFLAVNTANILNPMNIVDLVIDAGKGVSNTLEGTGNTITRPFKKEELENKE